MSIDELRGMEKAYKEIKTLCKGMQTKNAEDIIEKSTNSIASILVKHCDELISVIQESIDGEMERMYQMMEGKKDDRQDHRDL
jgi:vacuolar-type H+-ATPase subunit I/STV1